LLYIKQETGFVAKSANILRKIFFKIKVD